MISVIILFRIYFRDGQRYVCISFQWLLEGRRNDLIPCGKPIWRFLIRQHSGIDLFEEDWKIYSRNSGMTGHKIGMPCAVVENSMITDGCRIDGECGAFRILFCRRQGSNGSRGRRCRCHGRNGHQRPEQ